MAHSVLISAQEQEFIPLEYKDFVNILLDDVDHKSIVQMSVQNDGGGLPMFIPKLKQLFDVAKYQHGDDLTKTANSIGTIIPEIKTYLNHVFVRTMKPFTATPYFDFNTLKGRISKFSLRDWVKSIELFIQKLEIIILKIVKSMFLTFIMSFDVQEKYLKEEIATTIIFFSSAIINASRDKVAVKKLGLRYLKQTLSLFKNINLPTKLTDEMIHFKISEKMLNLTKDYSEWLFEMAKHLPEFIVTTFTTQIVFVRGILAEVFVPYLKKLKEFQVVSYDEQDEFTDFLNKMDKNSPEKKLYESTMERFSKPNYNNLKKSDYKDIVGLIVNHVRDIDIDYAKLDKLCFKLHGISVNDFIDSLSLPIIGVSVNMLLEKDNETIDGKFAFKTDGSKKTKKELEEERNELNTLLPKRKNALINVSKENGFYITTAGTEDKRKFDDLEFYYAEFVSTLDDYDSVDKISNSTIDRFLSSRFFLDRFDTEDKMIDLKEKMFLYYRDLHKRDAIVKEIEDIHTLQNRQYVIEYINDINVNLQNEQDLINEIFSLTEITQGADLELLGKEFELFMQWYERRSDKLREDDSQFVKELQTKFPFSNINYSDTLSVIAKCDELKKLRAKRKKLNEEQKYKTKIYNDRKRRLGFILKAIFGLISLWLIYHFISMFDSVMTTKNPFEYLKTATLPIDPKQPEIDKLLKSNDWNWFTWIDEIFLVNDWFSETFVGNPVVYRATGSRFLDFGRIIRNLMLGKGIGSALPVLVFSWKAFLGLNEIGFGFCNWISAFVMSYLDDSPQLYNQELENRLLLTGTSDRAQNLGMEFFQLSAATAAQIAKAQESLIFFGVQSFRFVNDARFLGAPAAMRALFLTSPPGTNYQNQLLLANQPTTNPGDIVLMPEQIPQQRQQFLPWYQEEIRKEIDEQNESNDNDNNTFTPKPRLAKKKGRIEIVD